MGKPAGPGRPLSARQAKFVEEYLKTGIATEAAKAAGYAHPRSQAARLLENVGIAAVSTAE